MSIADKAAHVRAELAAAMPTKHHCHWPDCDATVSPAAWGCRKHWYKLPAALRNKIWTAYRTGQEETKTPSRRYVEVAREVQDWIAANHPPAAKLLLRGRHPGVQKVPE